MPACLFAYRAPRGCTSGSPDVMAAWQGWFQSLGSQLADVGNPVFARRTVGNCGSDTDLGGYSLITADDLEAALAAASGSPLLRSRGGVEVDELTLLDPASLATTTQEHAAAAAAT
jgi:hypothetical protein